MGHLSPPLYIPQVSDLRLSLQSSLQWYLSNMKCYIYCAQRSIQLLSSIHRPSLNNSTHTTQGIVEQVIPDPVYAENMQRALPITTLKLVNTRTIFFSSR